MNLNLILLAMSLSVPLGPFPDTYIGGVSHSYLGEEASWVGRVLPAQGSLPGVQGRGEAPGALGAQGVPWGHSALALARQCVH